MPEDTDLPQATVVRRSRTRISVVWIIPILAAAVALGIAVQRILSEGPTITIVFKAAEGLEAGKTLVKYKDVSIGQVTAERLSPDYSKVEVTAKITKSAEGLMVEDAKFWVVQPRVTLSGVSGLGTLLSGNYVGIEVGKSTKKQRTFIGLEEPLIITVGQPGRSFVLKAANLGPLGVGAPVYYHSLQAGQVVSYSLPGDGDCSGARGDRDLPRSSARAPERPTGRHTRNPRAERDGAPRLHATAGRAAGAARAAPERESTDRAALRGVRPLPGHAQGEDRLESGRAGAAGDPEHAAGHRGQAYQHRHEARQAAAGGDWRRREKGAGVGGSGARERQ